MLALIKPSVAISTPSQIEARQRQQCLEARAARTDHLERELMAKRQELAALEHRMKQYEENSNSWDQLNSSVSMTMQDLPADEYNNQTRHLLHRTALDWVDDLSRAGVPADGLRWIITASNEYTVQLYTHVNESRAVHAAWLNRASRLTSTSSERDHQSH